jgi:hypothetical protein
MCTVASPHLFKWVSKHLIPFVVAGHTHLPSDCDFAKIEKFSENRIQAVHDPDD